MVDPRKDLPPRGSQADAEDVNDRAKQAASPFVLPPSGILETGAPFGASPEDFPEHPDTERTSFSDGSPPHQPPAPIQHTPHDDSDLMGPDGGLTGLDLGGLAQPGPAPHEEAPGTALATLPPEQPIASADPKAKAAAQALYGSDFPLLTEPTDVAWVQWAKTRWESHRAGMQKTLHLVERNRLMRGGDQWVTSTGVGPWREPPKPRDAVRTVDNVIQPALDQRVQIVREQTPGFRTRPTTRDPEAMKRAEAQQQALEYSYAEQEMPEVLAEAAYWAGTDGVSFLGPYWHPDVGPWAEAEQQPLGDIRTCVYRIEQVRVSANATATKRPHYWLIRETIPSADAVAMHGMAAVDADTSGSGTDLATTMQSGRLGLDTPGVDELYREQETVDRYTVYCERSDFLPNGLTLITVGAKVVFVGPLIYAVVPMARITDGSSDPAFYPTPVMNGWIPHQIRINALKSKRIESIRVNAGGRFIMKAGTTATETLVGGTTSIIEVKGAFNSIGDVLLPVNGFSVGQDVESAIEDEVASFEKKSGWNDASRGSFASDASGRAILAVREQLERIFAPGVASAAKGMSEWGKIVLHIYKAMLTLPRTMAIAGKGRPDLARALTADDFDGVSQVEIDPETLMPMPRSMRLYLLDQLYQTQVINAQEYRKRLPFAFTGSISTPDDGQEARAQRVADAIKNAQPAPELRWTDNESIHQDILEREILLVDSLDPMIVQLATQRWIELAQQAAMKSGGMMPGMQPPQGSGPPDGSPLPPQTAPLAGSNSSMASAPQQLSQSDQQAAGGSFDAMSAG